MQMACPICDRNGCYECNDTGWFDLTECPATFAGDETIEVLQSARYLKKGILPEPGALSDQPWRLMNLLEYAAGLIRAEEIANMGHLSPLLALGL